MNNLNIALGSDISFSYNPSGTTPPVGLSTGELRVGCLNFGADTIETSPATNDFWLFINNFTSAPTFGQLGYVQTADSNAAGSFYFTTGATGTVAVKPVPLPAGLWLLVSGLAGFGTMVRKRLTA